MIEVIGTFVGLVYLWLEYKASIHLWIAGIIMPAIYIYVYYEAGLYADAGINVYYLLAAVYGWLVWKFGRKPIAEGENTRSIQRLLAMPSAYVRKRVCVLTLITLALFLVMGAALDRFTDSTVPWLDSFTTALSIVAMWMLARKYVEQWGVWIVVDMVSAGLYIYKELYFTAVLYLLYAVIAVFGYRNWLQLMKDKNNF